ncbi:MAG: DUF3179 domain-containing protein [bacterium]|nr:DUF3179 domain-containing protein [bacterium]
MIPHHALLVPLALLVPGCRGDGHEEVEPSRAERLAGPWRQIEGEDLVEVLPRDGIPAIDDPTYVSAQEAEAFLAPDEAVLGVVGKNGTARAYSAWQLDRHEIVNDDLDGEPIAATW